MSAFCFISIAYALFFWLDNKRKSVELEEWSSRFYFWSLHIFCYKLRLVIFLMGNGKNKNNFIVMYNGINSIIIRAGKVQGK